MELGSTSVPRPLAPQQACSVVLLRRCFKFRTKYRQGVRTWHDKVRGWLRCGVRSHAASRRSRLQKRSSATGAKLRGILQGFRRQGSETPTVLNVNGMYTRLLLVLVLGV